MLQFWMDQIKSGDTIFDQRPSNAYIFFNAKFNIEINNNMNLWAVMSPSEAYTDTKFEITMVSLLWYK